MKLYNTYTNKIEQFEPLKKNKVKMYSCGPTVYSHAHIGNFRSFIVADLLKRFLKFKGYSVTHIMNITDVGHLLNDADEGEDRIELAAKESNKNPLEIAQIYIDSFMEASNLLNIEPPSHYPKATDHIKEMQDIIQKLVDKGFAYVVGQNVYYDVSKFKNYGKLSGNTISDLDDGARIEVNPEKKNPQDFALWKHDSKHLQQWESPWGKGFPGWHIECSAMSQKYLGASFDIHTGGEDNIFPHHECEIAQSEAANEKPYVKYWLHVRHLKLEGEKMAKSKGNFYTVQELVEQGYKKNAIRYVLLASHYKQNMNFSIQGIRAAEQALEKIDQFLFVLKDIQERDNSQIIRKEIEDLSKSSIQKFDDSLSDDLNVSKALAVLFDYIKAGNKVSKTTGAEAKLMTDTILQIDKVLGLLYASPFFELENIPEEIVKLAEERKVAKNSKDWKRADEIRDELLKKNYSIEDTPDGHYRLKRS